jgi:transcription elongation factor SPT6
LTNKPLDAFAHSSQFLHILAAEQDLLVTVTVHLRAEELATLRNDLTKAYLSDWSSSRAQAWNDIRTDIIEAALNEHLLPLASRWTRDWLKEKAEQYVGERCSEILESVSDAPPREGDGAFGLTLAC